MGRFAGLSVLALIASSASANLCSFDCSFSYNSTYSWDLSPLCTKGDRTINDAQGHKYVYQVCDLTQSSCFPDWVPRVSHGVAIQYWGATLGGPCYAPSGDEHPCTQECEVLGYNDPTDWSPIIENGGVTGVSYTHVVAQAAPGDQHVCDFDPSTLQPYKRQVTYEFRCDANVDFAQDAAVQDPNNDCHYKIQMRSCQACQGGCPAMPSTHRISGGSVFLIVLFSLLAIYLAAGVVFAKITTSEWTHPHVELWVAFGGLVSEGGRFTVATLTGKSTSKYANMDSSAAPASTGMSKSGGGFQSSNAGAGEFADL